jgi:L-iditol 2-dehydrogenase
MKVPVLGGAQKIGFQDKPIPKIGPRDVLVKVAYAAICGSDVRGYQTGMMMGASVEGKVLGHEFSGVVAEVGEETKDFQRNDRVGVKPLAPCGKCFWCGRGEYSLCPIGTSQLIGITPGYDGGFAEYVKIPHPEDMLFKLPANVSLEAASLLEPLSVALHALRLSRFKLGDRVIIIGAGMLGLSLLQFLRLGGAGKIIVLELSAKKCQLALESGADMVLNPLAEGKDVQERMFKLTDGMGADLVFDCAGVENSFQNAIKCVRRGGQIMLIGASPKEVPMNASQLLHWELEMKGVFGYYGEYHDVITLLSQGRINTNLLVSDILPITDAEKGIKRLLHSTDDVRLLLKH